tara:strand:- start:166 stop:924 length:759 start_codon:yes stop_codon:yes gene_type:complete
MNNIKTGWGLKNETWNAMDSLEKLGGEAWFRLGDKDLATHLYRTGRLSRGIGLAQTTAEITRAYDIKVNLLPMSQEKVDTIITLKNSGEEISFQEYFVKLHHAVAVSSISFSGSDNAKPGPGVIEAIEKSEKIIVAPSNPIVSIGPLLSISEIRNSLINRKKDVVAISPIIDGNALKGPADRLMRELGHEASVLGVAKFYREWISTLVIDEADLNHKDAINALGLECIVTNTIMSKPGIAASLASTALGVKS